VPKSIPLRNHWDAVIIGRSMLQYAMAMETDNFSIDKIVGDLKLYHIALIDDNSRRREFSINAYDGTRDTVGSRCYI